MKTRTQVAEATVNTGVTPEASQQIIELLKQTLADTYTLLVKTHNYHWNVSGMQWMALHELFEKQYQALFEATDEIAEQIRIAGGEAPGSMREFLQLSNLKEKEGRHRLDRDMIADLHEDHEHMCRQLRSAIEICEERCQDAATADFLTQRLREHTMTAWKLRAHLE